MNEPWITIVSLLLVSLGVLAALNLFRIFTADWRQGRREQRARPFRQHHWPRAPRPPEA